MAEDSLGNRSERIRERDTIKAILGGSVTAWHAFLAEYAELIYRVIARHMPAEDVDETRNVYVDILRSLYHGGLEKYEMRGSLHGWLAVYARRRAIDYVRSKYGRRRLPGGYEQLTRLEKDVFDIYVREHGSMEMLVHMLEWKGHRASVSEIAEAIARIEAVIDPRYLRSLDYERLARAWGPASAAAIQFVANMRWQYEQRTDASRPDVEMAANESRKRARRLREAIEELPQGDRDILQLKFEQGLAASEISRRLKLGPPRRVYTAVDRIVRKLRERLGLEPNG